MTKENILKKMENENMKLNEEKETIDYCPGCNVAYCRGRYTTGQCE
jgi:hypothetical protein